MSVLKFFGTAKQKRDPERKKAYDAAYYAAVRRLIQAHQADFSKYLAEELAKRGVVRRGT